MPIVEVIEVPAETLVEDSRAAERKRAVAAHAPARSVDGAGLSGLVELELVVAGDVAGAALGVE